MEFAGPFVLLLGLELLDFGIESCPTLLMEVDRVWTWSCLRWKLHLLDLRVGGCLSLELELELLSEFGAGVHLSLKLELLELGVGAT